MHIQDSPLLTATMHVLQSCVFIFPMLEFFSEFGMLSDFSPLTYVGSGLAGYFEAVSYGICEMIQIDPWPGAVWKCWAKHSPSTERPGVERHVELVPAVFPIQSR